MLLGFDAKVLSAFAVDYEKGQEAYYGSRISLSPR